MPELPEVETIKRDLLPKLVGQTLIKYGVIKGLDRKGKLLIFEFSDKYLLIHLKMTGQLIYVSGGDFIPGGHQGPTIEQLPNKYTREVFEFVDGARLYFNDMRKFGYVKKVKRLDLSGFGPEPWDSDFSLVEIRKKRRTSIKNILLNQKLVAGIGNIYADEICFYAGVRPYRRVPTLKLTDIKRLEKYCREVLRYAIKHRGTTFSSYRDGEGKRGGFQNLLKVYGRTGKTCKKCNQSKIKKIKHAGRGTHYCPRCQV